MKYLFVPDSISVDGRVTLRGKDHHYLTRVLRVKPGTRLTGRDSNGFLFDLEVLHVDGNGCTLSGKKRGRVESELPQISLYQGLPKGRKMDLIVRQAAEIGVLRVVPFYCERSVPTYADAAKKVERWKRIVMEACRQSGAESVPDVQRPLPFGEILTHPSSADGRLFFHTERIDEAQGLDQQSLHEYLSTNHLCTTVVVGPEGGFSDCETEQLCEAGFQPVRLRTNILRTETAAIYALAAVQAIITERESWQSK